MAKQSWTADEVEKLKKMAVAGASALRVSAALERPLVAVKNRTRIEGVPFPHDRVFIRTQREIAYR